MRVASLLLGVVALLVRPTLAQLPLPKAGVPEMADDKERVVVAGEIPKSLQGTWLRLERSDLGNNQWANGYLTLRFTLDGDRWVINQLLPQNVGPDAGTSFRDAVMKKVKWEPDEKALKDMVKALESARQPEIKWRARQYLLYDAQNLEKDAALPPEAKGAVLRFDLQGSAPSAAIVGASDYIQKIEPNRMYGYFTAGSVLTAPGGGVMPIGLHGDVVWYRLK